jgi:DNA sulfur modification protein DndB
MSFVYRFATVIGNQAGETYYISMVPLKLLPRLFIFEQDDISPEYRAQRVVNKKRVPVITRYILENRNNYVFSAIAASIDGEMSFKSIADNVGFLEIAMDSKFLINDGQHRKSAIEKALEEDPSLGDETISVVFYKDKGLKRSQQIFTDLNKHAVNTSKSLNALYDMRDPLAVQTKNSIKEINFFRRYTELEKDILGKYSSKLFTLNNFYKSNKLMFKNVPISKKNLAFIKKYWQAIYENILEWRELEEGLLSKKSLRSDYIVTQGTMLNAFGRLGNYFLINDIEPSIYLSKLQHIDWTRNSPNWKNRIIRHGRIIKSEKSINAAYIRIKHLIGIELTQKEKSFEILITESEDEQ